MDWNVAGVVAALTVCYVLYVHGQASVRAWPAWTLRLSDTRRALTQWLRLNTTTHLETLAGTLRVARASHEEGHEAEALRVIGQADKLTVLHVRLLRAWLQRWTDVTALLGLEPKPSPLSLPTPVRLAPLRGLRWAGRLGDVLLPTRSARFRLGMRFQRLALQCVGWSAGAARLRAQQLGQVGPALDELESTHSALVALDDQALAALDHVLHALPHNPRIMHDGIDSAHAGERR